MQLLHYIINPWWVVWLIEQHFGGIPREKKKHHVYYSYTWEVGPCTLLILITLTWFMKTYYWRKLVTVPFIIFAQKIITSTVRILTAVWAFCHEINWHTGFFLFRQSCHPKIVWQHCLWHYFMSIFKEYWMEQIVKISLTQTLFWYVIK